MWYRAKSVEIKVWSTDRGEVFKMAKKVIAVATSLALGLLLTASPSQGAVHKVSSYNPPVCCSF
jgi:hypothetical protein